MKNLICLIMMFVAGSMVSAAMKEDFESYNVGVLSTQGWVLGVGDAEIILGANGTKVAQACNNDYFQGTHGAAGQYTYPTGINVSSPGQAYFAAQMRPQCIGGYATYTVIGAFRYDLDYPLALIGIEAADNPVAYDRKGRFCFESAYWSTKQSSENVVMFDANQNGYIFDIAVNLDIVSSTEIYATLLYRNVSLGSDWVKSSVLNRVPFNNTFGIQVDARTFIRGYVGTEIDNFRMGMGHVGASAMIEDFESYNYGILSTQGWVFSQGQDGEVIAGSNITKSAQAYNNYYMQGTHGAPNSQNYVFASPVSVSSPGQAYFSAQMRPKSISGYATQTEIGTRRQDDYPGATIGINVAANPVAYDRNGRFCFSSPSWVGLQNSENVVMFDSNNNGYIFDIAVNLNITSPSSITASLSYRNVSLGGNWIKSTVLDNVPFDNTFGIQNQARTYLRGYIGTEIDNFRMGMGRIGAAAMIEDFESYTTNVLSTQGWVFAQGQDGEVITSGGSKVARAYNNYYMQGTHGAPNSQDYVFTSPINVSSPGQAYFSARMRPKSVGGYATQTEIGSQRQDGYPGATIGINIAANPAAYDRKGRFCFSSPSWNGVQNSENIIMFDGNGEGYLFDIAVNLEIVNSTDIYATLYYKNLSLGGEWIQSTVLSQVPFDNAFGIENQARTYLRGYGNTEIDNFQMGMGNIEGIVAGYNPFPGNGTSGVAPNAILQWDKGCSGQEVEVYFGTGWTEVAYAATASAEYMGRYNPNTGFSVLNYNANGLTPGATYYWRVDTPNAVRKSPVWSFKVNGGILSTDTQQAEMSSSLTPVYTPFEHENHSFNTAPDLFGYAPRFMPGVVTFDSDNRPYIITGQMGDGGSFTRGTVIQTLDNSGRWIGLDPYQSIKASYPTSWVDGEWKPMDRNIVFDDDNDAYMVVQIIVNGNESKTLLLYSRDKCWNWTCYELPNNTTWYGARLESRKGANEIAGPPAIVNDAYLGGSNIELIVPTKSNGALTIPSPVVITSTASWLTPDHSGFGNVAVTKGNYTHVVWMTLESLPGHTTTAPCYAATYNRTTHTASTPVVIGYTSSMDDHDGPVITMDSTGYLHVIIGAHAEKPFKYTKSTVANSSTGGWSTPIDVGAGIPAYPGQGYTYTAFLCDNNDTLHLVSRWAAPSPYVHMLSYMYKTSTGSWQSDTTLVDPNRSYYMCWYHELTMDRENRLFLRYSTMCNGLDRGLQTGEVAAYEAKWPAEAPLQLLDAGSDTYNTRSHDPVVLIKDNQGQGGSGWRLADTADFLNRMFKDGFEKNDFITAGWTKQNTNATVATAAKYTGTYGSKLAGTTWIQRTISTKGITGVHVKYNVKTYGMSGSEYVYVEWSVNGTTWNTLYSGRPTSWLLNQDNTCASGAENNANFRIRFRTNGSTTSKYAYVDDVEVTGTRF